MLKTVRSIMTDLQSIFTSNGVEYIDTPHYEDSDIQDIKAEYKEILDDFRY
ncbi:MAG: hypothetical protein R2728_04450 [Chitinophagales bacterium]